MLGIELYVLYWIFLYWCGREVIVEQIKQNKTKKHLPGGAFMYLTTKCHNKFFSFIRLCVQCWYDWTSFQMTRWEASKFVSPMWILTEHGACMAFACPSIYLHLSVARLTVCCLSSSLVFKNNLFNNMFSLPPPTSCRSEQLSLCTWCSKPTLTVSLHCW